MRETRPQTCQRLLWAALLVSAAVRAALVLQPACIDRNGVQLIEFARRITQSPGNAMRVTTRQPGYPLMVIGVQRLAGGMLGGDSPESWQRCGELIAFAGGTLTCVLLALLTSAAFSLSRQRHCIAALAALCAAVWPQAAHLSAGVLADMPHLAVFLLALWIALRAIDRANTWTLAAAGATVGTAYLIKQEAVALLPAIAWGWWRMTATSATPAARRWIGLFAFILAFCVTILPHSVITGDVLPNKDPGDLLRIFSATPKNDSHGVLAYAVTWSEAPLRLLGDFFRSGRGTLPLLFLIGALSSRTPRAAAAPGTLFASTAIVYAALVWLRAAAYGESSDRYAVILMALALPWAASGLHAILYALRDAFEGSLRTVAPAAVIVALLAAPVYYTARPVYGWKQHYREAGIRLRELAAPDDRVLAHEHLEQVLYYADRVYPADRWVKSRRRDSAVRIPRLIRGQRPKWYVDAEDTHKGELDEPAHMNWLNSTASPFERVESFGPAGKRVLIYRVRGS